MEKKSEVEILLRKNHTILRSRVTNISTIVSHLYSIKAISQEDKEYITNAYVNPTHGDKWDKISDILIRISSSTSSTFYKDSLMKMFEISENWHIIPFLEKDQAPSSSSSPRSVKVENREPDFRFRDIIRQNYEFLTYKLVNHEQVATQMFDEKIILSGKKNKIFSFLTNLEKADEILTCMLSGTSAEDYRKFLEILSDTGNTACFQVLEKAGEVKISDKLLKFEREEREALKGDFRVQNHHCVNIALKLSEVPGLAYNWDLICTEILTPRAIANIENERNFETKIMRTIQAWITKMGRDASYNLLIKKITPIHRGAAEELDSIREEISGFSNF